MVETGVVKYDVTDAAIAKMESQYMGLTILDIEDKEQFDAVHAGRMVIKNHRVAVEKKRKGLKADALEWGRKVDSEAKRIFGKLEPIEDHLMAEENKVLEAEKRRKEESDRIERKLIQGRVDSLMEYDLSLPFMEVATMSEEEYLNELIEAEKTWKAKQARIAAEQKAREEENKRLAEERAELERLQKEQAEAQTKIDAATRLIEADRKALEDEKRKEQERKDREAFEKQAAEKARKKAEDDQKERYEREAKENLERAAREIREAKEREEVEAAEKERLEKLRPDKEKLTDWANSLYEMTAPEVSDGNAKQIAENTLNEIYRVAEDLGQAIHYFK